MFTTMKPKELTTTHLKTNDEILNMEKFDTSAIVTSAEGKSLISAYLARQNKYCWYRQWIHNACLLLYQYKLWQHQRQTSNKSYFSTRNIYKVLSHILHTKEEAEMSQTGWLNIKTSLNHTNHVPVLWHQQTLTQWCSICFQWPIMAKAQVRTKSVSKMVYLLFCRSPGQTFDIHNIKTIFTLLEFHWKDRPLARNLPWFTA